MRVDAITLVLGNIWCINNTMIFYRRIDTMSAEGVRWIRREYIEPREALGFEIISLEGEVVPYKDRYVTRFHITYQMDDAEIKERYC